MDSRRRRSSNLCLSLELLLFGAIEIVLSWVLGSLVCCSWVFLNLLQLLSCYCLWLVAWFCFCCTFYCCPCWCCYCCCSLKLIFFCWMEIFFFYCWMELYYCCCKFYFAADAAAHFAASASLWNCPPYLSMHLVLILSLDIYKKLTFISPLSICNCWHFIEDIVNKKSKLTCIYVSPISVPMVNPYPFTTWPFLSELVLPEIIIAHF